MRRLALILLLLASPAFAVKPTSTATHTYTPTTSPTATPTNTPSATRTITQTPTRTATGTITATSTATGTITPVPTGLVVYNRDGRAIAVPIPMPTGAPAIVMGDGNTIGVRLDGGGGGGGGGSGGTGGTAASWTETLITSAGNPYVETVNTIPAGATVQRCIASTTVAVDGGYGFGVAGVPNAYAKLAGTAGETSATGNYFVAPHMNVVTSTRRITSRHASGLFQSTPGQVEVTCFYVVY